MSKKTGQLIKRWNKNIPIYIIFTFVLLIVLTVIFSLVGKETKEVKKVKQPDVIEEIPVVGTVNFGIIKEMNAENKTLTLYESESGQDINLYYTGASDFRDKYDQAKTIHQFFVGQAVNVSYDKNLLKIHKVVESSEVWEHSGVNLWNLDIEKNALIIGTSTYKLLDDVVIYRGMEVLSVEDLDNKDELYVIGKDRDIISIGVTKGHGTISFVEYDDFIGGIAYIGKREVIPITENMIITAREGTFDILFEKGGWKGTESVTLLPDDKITVSMEEFKKPPIVYGQVEFDIMPIGADLLIDGEVTNFDEIISLTYGEHTIDVSLGGYTSYQGKLNVLEEYSKVTIRLVETSTESEVSTEVQVESGTGNALSSDGETSIEDVTTEENNTSDEDTTENRNTSNEGNTVNEDTNTEDNNTDDNSNDDNSTTNDNSELEDTNDSSIDNLEDDASEDSSSSQQEGEYIHVEEPSNVSIYFDGEFMGNTPVSFKKQEGTHYVTLIKDGYETKTYTVQVEDDNKNTVLNFPDLNKNE